MLRRISSVAVLAVLVLFLVRNPLDAALAVTGIGHVLLAVADALGTFVSAL